MTAALVAPAVLVAAAVGLTVARGGRHLAASRYVDVLPSRSRRPWIHAWRWRRGGDPLGDAEVAEWCEQVAASLRGGRSLTMAIVDTDDACGGRPVLPAVTHALRRGRGLADALDSMPVDPSTPHGLVVPVLAASAHMGGPAASAMDRVAVTLQARDAERAERRTASAQARLSARVLSTVPFAVLALLAVTEPSVRAALVTAAGAACLVVGGGLNLAGWWWMRRLIGGAR